MRTPQKRGSGPRQTNAHQTASPTQNKNGVRTRTNLCALSLAPCSPLKPPNDTLRPEELNQFMIVSYSEYVLASTLVSLELEKSGAPRPRSYIYFAPPLCELQQSRSQVRQQCLRQSSGGKTLMKSPKIHRVLVYTDKEGIPG